MVLKDNPLSGEERKIVSTRLYKSEFLYFKKLCEKEGKKINAKLREMIRKELNLREDERKNL
ncbi:MAG: hypothetical protein AABW56_00070 [Nanoarchaeota archaeon]